MAHPDYAHIGSPDVRCIEECGELIQAIVKAQRFGLHATHPVTGVSNHTRILDEMLDVCTTINELVKYMEDLDGSAKPAEPLKPN